jgi:hypothetical protein
MKKLWLLVTVVTLFSCSKSELSVVNTPSQTIVLKGEIVNNKTLTANNEYILDGNVYVKNCSQLTIEPGTVIKSSNSSMLIIEQCSKIVANGTSSKPIVFTSSKPDGQKSPGDFGGLIILGYAQTNHNTSIFSGYQCLPLSFGGNNDNDNSGILRYVRIEYGGYSTLGDFDLGALTLAGVGKGTTIENIQSSYSGDCSFYWMGGTVNASNLYAYASGDDDFSFDYGYTGFVKNSIGKKDKNYCYKPMIGEKFNNGNGIECKNNGTALKTTYPKLDNMLLVLDSSNLRIGSGLYIDGISKFELTNSTISEWNVLGMILSSYEGTQYYKNNSSKLLSNKFGSIEDNLCFASSHPTLMTTTELKTKAKLDGNVEIYMTKQQTEILSKPSWINRWTRFPTKGN